MDDAKQTLVDITKEEEIYRKLYLLNASAYEEPIKNWDEFVEKYRTTACSGMNIPSKAPSIMEPNLSERDWFPPDGREVSVIRNARYCPPFLHQLEFIKIIYVLNGQCTLFVYHKKIEMNRGSFCVIPPNIEQSMFSCNDEDIVLNIIIKRSTFSNAFSSLLAEPEKISNFFWQMLYSKNSNQIMLFNCKSTPTPELNRTILEIYQEALVEKHPSNLLIKSFVLIFWGYVLRYHEKDLIFLENDQEIDYHLPILIRYIKENMRDITLSSLAEHFHMSEGYTSRYIKKETGYTFLYLLRDFRMKQAAEMLKHSKCCIEDIIEAIGYTDESHFYRSFKEMFGITPTNFRKHEDIFLIGGGKDCTDYHNK